MKYVAPSRKLLPGCVEFILHEGRRKGLSVTWFKVCNRATDPGKLLIVYVEQFIEADIINDLYLYLPGA